MSHLEQSKIRALIKREVQRQVKKELRKALKLKPREEKRGFFKKILERIQNE